MMTTTTPKPREGQVAGVRKASEGQGRTKFPSFFISGNAVWECIRMCTP